MICVTMYLCMMEEIKIIINMFLKYVLEYLVDERARGI